MNTHTHNPKANLRPADGETIQIGNGSLVVKRTLPIADGWIVDALGGSRWRIYEDGSALSSDYKATTWSR